MASDRSDQLSIRCRLAVGAGCSGPIGPSNATEDVFDAALLTEVYQHPMSVVEHPLTGELLVLAQPV